VKVGICFSASRYYISLLLIVPKMRMKNELLDCAPQRSVAVSHWSGWKRHFINHTKLSKDDSVLQCFLMDI
jgi:hypothetical protein